MRKILIVGGGLSGLVAANLLTKCAEVVLLEKKQYPFHRVCGEYISNETVPFLQRYGLLPNFDALPVIKTLWITSVNGRKSELPLDLGGFGISRYAFDHFLFQQAVKNGAQVFENCEANTITLAGDRFLVETSEKIFEADVVIGSFGKRSRIDKAMNRSFMQKKSPYVAVKYHIRVPHPSDVIALHNFKDGYCGISNVEDGKSTLCYLTHRNNLKSHKQIDVMERNVVCRNPYLKEIFARAEFLYDKPETINEISFETKQAVENHVIMCGDAAGMITPLCGNGMALAIHSAKIAAELITDFAEGRKSRAQLEHDYTKRWNQLFATRLWAGRQIQKLFGNEWTSDLAVNLARYASPVATWLVKQTHGKPF